MKKEVKENIKKTVEMMKEVIKLSDEKYFEVFGVKKEVGINNILDSILRDLEK